MASLREISKPEIKKENNSGKKGLRSLETKTPEKIVGNIFLVSAKVLDIIQSTSVGQVVKTLSNAKVIPELQRLSLLRKEVREKIELLYGKRFENTIKQGRVGNCYFLSSLEMTKSNEKGKINIIDMIEIIEDSSKKGYSVKFPGNNKKIYISKTELELISGKGYDLKKGTLGDKIITIAHMKYKYENSSLFREKNIPFEEYIKTHKRQKYADMVFENGQEADAIKLLWGEKNVIVDYFYITRNGIGFNKGEMFAPPKGLAKISNTISYDDLSRFFNEGAMIGVGTKRKGHPGINSNKESFVIQKDFYGNEVKILGPHAYWVKGIDIKNRFIEVSEPFDSQKVIRFTLDQFNSIFNSITLVRQRK